MRYLAGRLPYLDEGAGFNFNSKQSRLHSAIDVGETLWLFTALKAPPRCFLAAKLVVRSKTLNAPGHRYGKYRVWGDLARSRYFRVRPDVAQDEAFELLRGLPLVSGSLAKATRATLPQGCQTIRGVTPQGRLLLDAFAKALVTEERSHQVIDEYTWSSPYGRATGPLTRSTTLRSGRRRWPSCPRRAIAGERAGRSKSGPSG